LSRTDAELVNLVVPIKTAGWASSRAKYRSLGPRTTRLITGRSEWSPSEAPAVQVSDEGRSPRAQPAQQSGLLRDLQLYAVTPVGATSVSVELPVRALAAAVGAGLLCVGLAACGASTSTTRASSSTTQPTTASSAFSPSLVARAGTSDTVFVLGTASCGSGLCLQLWRGQAGSGATRGHFTEVNAPPSAAPRYAGSIGSVRQLVFANTEDGYALELEPNSIWMTAFATSNGGKSWHSVSFGPNVTVFAMVASAQHVYAVLVHWANSTGRRNA